MSNSIDSKVFDLTNPPSRAEVGLPEGKDQFTHQNSDMSKFAVRVLLPAGKQLAFDALSVGVDSLGAGDPPSGDPTTMDVTYEAESLDAARDHLLGAAAQFGLNAEAVRDWHEQAQSVTEIPVRSPWLRTTLGYLIFEVRGNHSATRTTVHYVLSWT